MPPQKSHLEKSDDFKKKSFGIFPYKNFFSLERFRQIIKNRRKVFKSQKSPKSKNLPKSSNFSKKSYSKVPYIKYQ